MYVFFFKLSLLDDELSKNSETYDLSEANNTARKGLVEFFRTCQNHRTHKHEVCSFNEYYAVDRACKKVISKLIPERIYKSLLSRIIGFAKVTSLEILTHLITEYAELEKEDVQDIDQKMKEPISGETLFEEFVKQIECNQEAVAM